MSDWTSCPCCDGDGGMTSGSYPDQKVRGGQYRATPAPLDVLVAALKIIAASPSPAMSTDAIGITARNIARLALKQAATPAPLDGLQKALRRQHLEETHRASGSCPGWTCPTARVLALLMEPKP